MSRLLVPALLAAIGLVLWRGTWDAGWISEDASVVRHLSNEGALADWWRSQYGMRTILFWRPLVSMTLWLQLELFGPDPFALRLFNAACQVAAGTLMFHLARRMGCRWFASLAAALLTLTFPHQGGTVTWVVGRVDSLCWPLMLGALLAVSHGRGRTAAVCAVLALATKEMAAALAPIAIVLAWTWPERPERPEVVRAARTLVVALVLAWLWRWISVGEFVGGYPGSVDFTSPLASLAAAFVVLGPVAFALPFAAVLGRTSHVLEVRAIQVGLLGAAAALFVLMPLLVGGMQPEHLRWLAVPDGLVCLAWAGCCGRAPWTREAPRVLPMGVLLLGTAVLIGVRSAQARDSVRTWAAAAGEVADFVERVDTGRAALGLDGPSDLPVLVGAVPSLDASGTAYTLHFGLPDHFTSPIGDRRRGANADDTRAVWAWKPLYPAARVDPPLGGPGAGFDPPLLDPADLVATLEVEGPRSFFLAGEEVPDVRWRCPDDAAYALLVTPLGYDLATLPEQGVRGYAPRAIFAEAAAATPLWRSLAFITDFGGREALLLFATADGRVSEWVRVGWDEDAARAFRANVR